MAPCIGLGYYDVWIDDRTNYWTAVYLFSILKGVIISYVYEDNNIVESY